MAASGGWSAYPGDTGIAVATVGPVPQAALAAADARCVAALDWDALDELAHTQALVIAAVPADCGHGALETLATLIDDHALDAVVAFEGHALDPVAAALMGARTVLLCDPDAGDWAAALALAAMQGKAIGAGVREGGDEAERLRRLHEAVARIAAELAALSVKGTGETTVADRRTRYAAGPGRAEPIDPAEIRRVIRARRLRAQFFDARLMEDPGWDMLLDLFAAELERTQVSVSSLCIAAAVAPTTALRWISRMADAGLMKRVADTDDRRRAFVALSPAASDAMRAYVGAARRAGVPLV